MLDEIAPSLGIEPSIAVLPISVAALMSAEWVARHLNIPPGVDRIILPGHCRGDLTVLIDQAAPALIELGPQDLRELPLYLGSRKHEPANYGQYDIEIIAEINHAPRLSRMELLEKAAIFRREGADRIDLGCEADGGWSGVGEAVHILIQEGYKVSIDSFDPKEVSQAVASGADLILSINKSNRECARDYGVEVVAIPDTPGTLQGFEETIAYLKSFSIRFRADPILEPIAFGFTNSIVRYHQIRTQYPDIEMMMGIGNLTELTDVDSSGVNTLLIGVCQELGIRSILTTEEINWARSSVQEIDLARRLAYHAVTKRTLPKHVETRLIALRDPRVPKFGIERLNELAKRIKDPNWRIFAEDGKIHAMNNSLHLVGSDPFLIFREMGVTDASHAFYLGYELMKAKTALTLSKAYRQDQALDWGYLTEPEVSHRSTRQQKAENQL